MLKRKTPWRDRTTHLVLSPLEFMQRLAARIPRPRLHLIRFHGALAPNAKLRALVVAQGPCEAQEAAEAEMAVDCAGPGAKPFRRMDGRAASTGRDCSSECSTPTCSAARTAVPAS